MTTDTHDPVTAEEIAEVARLDGEAPDIWIECEDNECLYVSTEDGAERLFGPTVHTLAVDFIACARTLRAHSVGRLADLAPILARAVIEAPSQPTTTRDETLDRIAEIIGRVHEADGHNSMRAADEVLIERVEELARIERDQPAPLTEGEAAFLVRLIGQQRPFDGDGDLLRKLRAMGSASRRAIPPEVRPVQTAAVAELEDQ